MGAMAYAAQGNSKLAIADLDKAIELDPKASRTYLLRGQVYADLKNADKAAADLEQALKLGLDAQSKQAAEKLLANLKKAKAQPTPKPAPASAASWNGLPIMPGARSGYEQGDIYVYVAPASLDVVRGFYKQELPKLGWAFVGMDSKWRHK